MCGGVCGGVYGRVSGRELPASIEDEGEWWQRWFQCMEHHWSTLAWSCSQGARAEDQGMKEEHRDPCFRLLYGIRMLLRPRLLSGSQKFWRERFLGSRHGGCPCTKSGDETTDNHDRCRAGRSGLGFRGRHTMETMNGEP